MADIVSAKDKMTDVEIAHNQPHSEDLMTKFGANVNALIDDSADHESRLDAIEAVSGSAKASDLTATSPVQWLASEDSVEKSIGLEASVTTTGRGVFIYFFDNEAEYPTSSPSSWADAAGLAGYAVKLYRDSTVIKTWNSTLNIGPFFFDTPAAGTYTYKLQVLSGTISSGTPDLTVGWKLRLYAL